MDSYWNRSLVEQVNGLPDCVITEINGKRLTSPLHVKQGDTLRLDGHEARLIRQQVAQVSTFAVREGKQ